MHPVHPGWIRPFESKKISNVQELTMQLSQTLSSAVAQSKFQTAQLQITQQRLCPSAQLSSFYIYIFFIIFLLLLLLKKDFEGLIDVFPL